jgi:uncharacterized SAM-binding protein YcdF (DUF218 family)
MLDLLLRQLLLLLQPVGLVWLGLLILAIALFRARRRRSGSLAVLLFVVVTLCGSTDLPGWLLRGLEKPWAGVKMADLPACDAVIVLGGGAEPSRFEVGEVHLTKAGDRLIMGMELVRLGKAPVLAIGGNVANFSGVQKVEADLVKGLLETWRFPTAEIVSLGTNSNTRDEGEKVRALATQRGWKRVLLVTSACHMTRALAVFRALGIEAVPAPCNFLTSLSTAPVDFRLTVPHWAGFEKISIWAHETAGWWIYRSRGWIAG